MRVYSQMLGSLLLRTYARAQRIYQAMLSRGFDGSVRVMRTLHFTGHDTAFMLGWSFALVFMRLYNVPLLIGDLVTGLIS